MTLCLMQGNIISKPLTCSLSQVGVNVKRPHEEDMSPELLNLIPKLMPPMFQLTLTIIKTLDCIKLPFRLVTTKLRWPGVGLKKTACHTWWYYRSWILLVCLSRVE